MFDGAGDVYFQADAVGAVGFIVVAVSVVAKRNVDANDVAVGTSAVVCRCCLRLCNTPKTWISITLLKGFMAKEEIEK